MIEQISKITLYVNDQQKAKAFWVDQLGFEVVLEQAMGPTLWLEVAPKASQTTFVLYDKKLMQTQNPATNVSHPSIILSTQTIENDYQEMKAKGISVGELMKLPYGQMFSFKDQDGNDYLLRDN